MPLERVSRSFRDISMSFLVNPLTKDIVDLKNETAISRSIRNLVLTNQGERFFNNNLGSRISRSLFENIDFTTADIIKTEIENTIENYEPRANLIEVKVEPDYDNSSFNVTVTYSVIGIDALPQQLSFVLLPTR